ncbi:MAG: TonB family protein [Pseudobdellovibrionaceae bacterium]|nr:MAG: TonB family protein [Pseudobdellovibrionaceae bacterium]
MGRNHRQLSTRRLMALVFSVVAHVGTAIGVIAYHKQDTKPVAQPLGNIEGEFIEFSAPLGEQIETVDVGIVGGDQKSDAPSTTEVVKAESLPEPVANTQAVADSSPVTLPPPKIKSTKVSTPVKKQEKPKIAKVLPQKTVKEEPIVETEKALPEAVATVDESLVSENSDADIEKVVVDEETQEKSTGTTSDEDDQQVADMKELENEILADESEKFEDITDLGEKPETVIPVAEKAVAPTPVKAQPLPAPKPKAVARQALPPRTSPLEQRQAVAPRTSPLAQRSGKGWGLGKNGSASSQQAYGLPSGTRDVRDLNPIPGNKPPSYPMQARLERKEGQVKLLYYVTPNGSVTNLKVLNSSGDRRLDQEAAQSIARWRFYPGQQGHTVHNVNFSLKGSEQVIPARLRTASADTKKKQQD